MIILKLTKVEMERNAVFEVTGWKDMGPILFSLQEFAVAPSGIDPKVSVVSFMDRDVFVRESVDEIEKLINGVQA